MFNYLKIATGVPKEDINGWLRRHAQLPINPKSSAAQVARYLETTVNIHGKAAQLELIELYKNHEAEKESDSKKSSCGCNGGSSDKSASGKGCPCSPKRKLNAEGEAVVVDTTVSDFKTFVTKNSTLLIIGTFALAFALIIRSGKNKA